MRVFFALCALSFLPSAFAATVMVSIVQNADAPPAAIETTRLLESQIMDEYFAAGKIVTSMPIISGAPLPASESNARIREAAEGMADFLLSIYLEYDPIARQAAQSGTVLARLKKAEWQVVDVATSEIAGGGTIIIEESDVRALKAVKEISRESLMVQHEVRR